jgi:predicted phage replisome organizer
LAEVKWIKITTDMFDNRKIKHLRKMPEGNNIVLIWVMLLTMAGRCNASGMIFLTENIPYTTKMLADELDFDENTIILALRVLSEFGMIVFDEKNFSISNWQEHQNIDGMEKIKEQNRKRVAKYREKQKLLACNVTSNVTVTESNAIDIDIDKEIDIDNNIITEKSNNELLQTKNEHINYQKIVDEYNSICVSLSKVKKITNARKKSINARLKIYTFDEIIEVFKKAEASDFLKGANNINFQAGFDWLMADKNMAKVLEGKYDNKKSFNQPTTTIEKPKTTNKFNSFSQRKYTTEQLDELERKLLSK